LSVGYNTLINLRESSAARPPFIPSQRNRPHGIMHSDHFLHVFWGSTRTLMGRVESVVGGSKLGSFVWVAPQSGVALAHGVDGSLI
jgi:hypothetical protein